MCALGSRYQLLRILIKLSLNSDMKLCRLAAILKMCLEDSISVDLYTEVSLNFLSPDRKITNALKAKNQFNIFSISFILLSPSVFKGTVGNLSS